MSGQSFQQCLSAATWRMRIHAGSAGMILSFAGRAADGFRVSFGKRAAKKPCEGLLGQTLAAPERVHGDERRRREQVADQKVDDVVISRVDDGI